jgi:D-alanine transaminase
MTVYLNGEFVPKDQARVSPDDRGFLFADGVYEVLRAYNGRFFHAPAHWQRLARSLNEIRLTSTGKVDFQAIAEALLQRNNLLSGDAIVYVQVTRGAAPRNHAFPDPATPPTVYAYAAPFQPVPRKLEAGVAVVLTPEMRWSRCDIKSIALLGNVLAGQHAKDNGGEEALFVRGGAVTEGSRTNFAAVFDGQLVTHPQNNFILGGITLNAVLGLCRDLNIRVKESPIPAAELPRAEEAMLLGTTAEVTPVVQVDGKPVGNGQPGPVTRRLQGAFRELTVKGG